MKKRKKLLRCFLTVFLLGAITFFAVNGYVRITAGAKITSVKELETTREKADAVLVLGAQVKPDGSPCAMLKERLDTGIQIYQSGLTDRIIMSGDHGRDDYDEVNAMKNYAMERGVPSEHIFMDHAGFSTYESMYRAKEIFQTEDIIVVTQKYHLYRAVYDAEAMGLETRGVACDTEVYSGDTYRKLRESVAIAKDVGYSVLKPEPTFLGDPIPISGNGDATNDNEGIL
ncbi:MAG: YdcF family protein [Lachnospiraceae bacterium]